MGLNWLGGRAKFPLRDRNGDVPKGRSPIRLTSRCFSKVKHFTGVQQFYEQTGP